MPTQVHIIKKLTYELTAESEPLAKQMHDIIDRDFSAKINNCIEQCFATHCDSNQLYKIDSLALDLGEVEYANVHKKLLSRFEKHFTKQIKAQLLKADKRGIDHPKINHEITDNKLNKTSGELEKESKEHSALALIGDYLKSGQLPWWADISDSTLLVRTLIEQLNVGPNPLANMLCNILYQENAVTRLIETLDDDVLYKLFTSMSFGLSNVEMSLVKKLLSFITDITPLAKVPASDVRQEVFKALFNNIDLSNNGKATENFIANVFAFIAQQLTLSETKLHALFALRLSQPVDAQFHQRFSALFRLVRLKPKNSDLRKQIKALLIYYQPVGFTPLKLMDYLQETGLFDVSVTFSNGQINAVIKTLENNIAKQWHQQKLEGELKEIIAEQTSVKQSSLYVPEKPSLTDLLIQQDEIYVDNAGLVMLWPYLQRLFENLQYLENHQFISEQAQQKAIAVLQYLSDEKNPVVEYRLSLNKVICGLAPQANYRMGDALSSHEKSIADQMLLAVIDNAEVLKNTSIDGLRCNYLARKGVLSQHQGLWLLQVEKQTKDIVLDQLPWTFLWFKLPWMKQTMRIEW